MPNFDKSIGLSQLVLPQDLGKYEIAPTGFERYEIAKRFATAFA